MIDTETPEGKWFKVLAQALADRRTGRSGTSQYNRASLRPNRVRPGLDLLDDYFRGDPPLICHEGWTEQVRTFLRMGRLNIADLLVSSTANRMQLRDFKTAAAEDEVGDQKAREIMRANAGKIFTREVNETMLSLGDGYTIVTPPSSDGEHSLITAEDPRQVITAHDPATGKTLAALKMFRDDWNSADLAYLYLPGKVRPAVLKSGTSSLGRRAFRMSNKWTWLDDEEQDVPGGRLPVHRFRNRFGVGEFERHLDTLDRINDKIFNEWWISKIQAFRQRAVKNLPDKDEDTGEDIDYTDMFTTSPDEMWRVPGDVDFWESTPVDLGPIVNSIQKDLERLAAATSNPLHTITPDAANGSAEGASLMREEHVYKIEDRRDRVESPYAATMSDAFYFEGDTERADVTQIDLIWGPVERHSLSVRASSAQQLDGILPDEAIFTDVLQYAPADVPGLRTLLGRQLLFRAPPANPQPDNN